MVTAILTFVLPSARNMASVPATGSPKSFETCVSYRQVVDDTILVACDRLKGAGYLFYVAQVEQADGEIP